MNNEEYTPERQEPAADVQPEETDVQPEEAGPQPEPSPGEGGDAADGDKKEKDEGKELYTFCRTLVLALSALVLVFTFLGRLITVDGISMEPTLLHGELMLVHSAGYTPAQGDIVVLTQPTFREDAIVKRVIALGGQRVDIDYLAGTVSVDGVVLDEPYINETMLPRGDVTQIVVPEGCIFVMGDNRNVSADSRYNDVGVIDARRVIGRAVVVIFPFDRFAVL